MEKIEVQNPDFGLLAAMLRKVDFFTPLTIGQIERLIPYIMLFSCRKGETVFKQGEIGDAFYIIQSGKVEVKVKTGFLFSKTVQNLGPGDFFGEIALISREPRTATIKCLEPVALFVLAAGNFDLVLRQNPAAAAEMKKIAERRKFESLRQTG
ncbi:MAG: hypothetical protein A3J74_05645 [Elusimicrobia bacterium RIFCSPHIGHO2_02_FULL_57_9]|nr:MAG: hypothetical protein A3J74_05645 [Elusimicrobia bacterium RIFCSPHIGHO2_02_FULL_57_9]